MYDDFDENTFYYSPKITFLYQGHTILNIFDGMYFYIGTKDDRVWLRGVIEYSGDNWIFMEKIEIKTGEKIYDVNFDYDDINRRSGGIVHEKYDCDATEELYDIAKEIVENNEGKIKFIGDDRKKTKDITEEEIAGLAHIIRVYDSLTIIE